MVLKTSSSSASVGSFFNRWLAIGVASSIFIGAGATLIFAPHAVLGERRASWITYTVGGCALVAGVFGALIVGSPRFLYLTSLAITLSRNRIMNYNHYDYVTDSIILGALPLSSNFDALVRTERITAVLSLVQEHEFTPSMFHHPVQHEEWLRAGVQHYWVQTPDYEPVPVGSLMDAAKFIQQHAETGKVYIHCKAGRGRSTAALVVYLCHYRMMGAVEAMEFVRQRRPQINLNRRQRAAVFEACEGKETKGD